MASKVAVFIADGTEPVEVIAPTDALRRGGVDVRLISVMGHQVVLAQDVVVTTEEQIGEVDLDQFDMLVVPGGSIGVEHLGKCKPMFEALKKGADKGKHIASICAGPTILAKLGLLDGYKATCYPGCEADFPEGSYVEGPTVVVDRNVITASGPAKALDFGIAMLRVLEGDKVADDVAAGMLVTK